ncbi:MAG: HdeD family acid-resistance protein [Xanthobacteraceae bacterium]
MTLPQDTGSQNTGSQDIGDLRSRFQTAVRKRWLAFLIEGILLVIIGFAAILVPPLASIAVTVFLGWLFIISGVAALALTLWAREIPGFWWSLISALLAIAVGVILLARPIQGTLTLTIVVGAYFLAEGVTTIMYALEHRRALPQRWGWMLTAGLMDILVAIIIVAGLPGSALWAIGLLVGINLVFGGATLIGVALAARNS